MSSLETFCRENGIKLSPALHKTWLESSLREQLKIEVKHMLFWRPLSSYLVLGSEETNLIKEEEFTGGSSSYYMLTVTNPTTLPDPYGVECNDIIEALGMNYAEGNAFKAIWRSCAARKLGRKKKGYDNGLYDAEKVEFFGKRMVELAKATQEKGDSK